MEELHHQELGALDLSGVGGPHDVGMVEAADGLHLALESGHRPCVRHPPAGQDLQGHLPSQAAVQGLIDRSHAAAAQLLQELVVGQLPEPHLVGLGLLGGGARVVGRVAGDVRGFGQCLPEFRLLEVSV